MEIKKKEEQQPPIEIFAELRHMALASLLPIEQFIAKDVYASLPLDFRAIEAGQELTAVNAQEESEKLKNILQEVKEALASDASAVSAAALKPLESASNQESSDSVLEMFERDLAELMVKRSHLTIATITDKNQPIRSRQIDSTTPGGRGSAQKRKKQQQQQQEESSRRGSTANKRARHRVVLKLPVAKRRKSVKEGRKRLHEIMGLFESNGIENVSDEVKREFTEVLEDLVQTVKLGSGSGSVVASTDKPAGNGDVVMKENEDENNLHLLKQCAVLGRQLLQSAEGEQEMMGKLFGIEALITIYKFQQELDNPQNSSLLLIEDDVEVTQLIDNLRIIVEEDETSGEEDWKECARLMKIIYDCLNVLSEEMVVKIAYMCVSVVSKNKLKKTKVATGDDDNEEVDSDVKQEQLFAFLTVKYNCVNIMKWIYRRYKDYQMFLLDEVLVMAIGEECLDGQVDDGFKYYFCQQSNRQQTDCNFIHLKSFLLLSFTEGRREQAVYVAKNLLKKQSELQVVAGDCLKVLGRCEFVGCVPLTEALMLTVKEQLINIMQKGPGAACVGSKKLKNNEMTQLIDILTEIQRALGQLTKKVKEFSEQLTENEEDLFWNASSPSQEKESVANVNTALNLYLDSLQTVVGEFDYQREYLGLQTRSHSAKENIVVPTGEEVLLMTARILIKREDLLFGEPVLVSTLTLLLDLLNEGNSQSQSMRLKSLRSIHQLIRLYGFLGDFQQLFLQRIQDPSASVRELSLELVGQLILDDDLLHVDKRLYRHISSRILDTSLNVRKRVIKILEDLYKRNLDCCMKSDEGESFEYMADITSKLINRLVYDEEESLKQLACKVLVSVLFPTAVMCLRENEGVVDVYDLTDRLKSISLNEVSVKQDKILRLSFRIIQSSDLLQSAAFAVTINAGGNGNDGSDSSPMGQLLHYCSGEGAKKKRSSSSQEIVDFIQLYVLLAVENLTEGHLFIKSVASYFPECIFTVLTPLMSQFTQLVLENRHKSPFKAAESRPELNDFKTTAYNLLFAICTCIESLIPNVQTTHYGCIPVPTQPVIQQLTHVLVLLMNKESSTLLLEKTIQALSLVCNRLLVQTNPADPTIISQIFMKCFSSCLGGPENGSSGRFLYIASSIIKHDQLVFASQGSNVRQLYNYALSVLPISSSTVASLGNLWHANETYLLLESTHDLIMASFKKHPHQLLLLFTQLMDKEERKKSFSSTREESALASYTSSTTITSVLQKYAPNILELTLSVVGDGGEHSCDQSMPTRSLAFEIIRRLSILGFIHPLESIQYLIAIEVTDASNESTSAMMLLKNVQHLHKHLLKRYPSFINQRNIEGIRLALGTNDAHLCGYLQLSNVGATPSAVSARTPISRNDELGSGSCTALYESRLLFLYQQAKSLSTRRDLLNQLLNAIDSAATSNANSGEGGTILKFICEAMAYLPYKSVYEVLLLYTRLNSTLAFLHPDDSPEQQQQNEDKADDLQIIMQLQQFIKRSYNLTEAKISTFSANDHMKSFDKPANRKLAGIPPFESFLDYTNNDYREEDTDHLKQGYQNAVVNTPVAAIQAVMNNNSTTV